MLERLGIKADIKDRWELALVGLSLALVAVTPLGKEASAAWALGAYRTILVAILVVYAFAPARILLPRVSPYYLSGVAAVLGVLFLSVVTIEGSRFEAFYAFYEKGLFIAVFLSLAHFSLTRSIQSRNAVLAGVVAISAIYVIAALASAQQPLLGPFVNPNYFASFLLPGVAICAVTALSNAASRTRLVAASAGIFLYFGIIRTASRGATLAGLAMLCLCAVRAARRQNISGRRLLIACALIGAITLAASPTLVQKFLDRGTFDPFNYQRTNIWLGTLSMISEQPLTGVGLRQYYYEAKRFTPPVEGGIARYRRWPNIAHSEYLQYMAEIGIPGALLLFGLGGYLLMNAWRRAGHQEKDEARLNEISVLTIVALACHALVDNNWTVPVAAAGVVVASQGNLLPYSLSPATRKFTLTLKVALAIVLGAVWLEAAAVPATGLHFNEKGQAALDAGNLESSVNYHRLALNIIPENAVLLDNLGLVYLEQFDRTGRQEFLDRAEGVFVEAMSESPRFDLPGSHLEATLIHRLTGDPNLDRPIHSRIADAGRHVLRASPINPLARKNLAEALYNLGEKEQAYEQLRIALQFEPNFVPALLKLADWYEAEGRQQESNDYRQRGIATVVRFKDTRTSDFIEDALLGRPMGAWAKK
jgi:O-antigen ligase